MNRPTTIEPKQKSKSSTTSLLKEREERLRILDSIQGMWKNKKPDPIKELKKIRKEWDRKLL